ncbi:LysM peptidoglycan-binding domain-containing protein [Streptomyces agglomeratus]|uniref:LysM peptidoglycan-binding domain-containing protein n=1 Tax=Streptomyces agglomeratus TaxID=285458 RepID=UPI00159F03E9|nr:LysM peptidoglycan-binding domain-containing protein [Streptomyces agglomeratus]
MSGDTLWDIAARNLGDPERWTEIYDANQTVIEAAAREHPAPPVLGTSDRGHWIFPGTTLTIPAASCAPTTTTPTTPPTETTPTSGGVSDEEACKAAGGIPAENQSGDFFCGSFGTISVLEHPFSPGELDQLKFAEDTVGCLGSIGGVTSRLSTALSGQGKKVVKAVLFVNGAAKLEGDLETLAKELETLDLEPSDKVQIVTKVKDDTSDHIANVVWDIAWDLAGLAGVPGAACAKLFINRAIAIIG